LFDLLGATEASARFAKGFFGSHSVPHLLGGDKIEIPAEFFVKLLIEAFLTEDVSPERVQMSEHNQPPMLPVKHSP
jgi:hypothetical protein